MGPATGAGPRREGTAGGLDLALEDTMGPAAGAGPRREGTAGGLDLALEDTMGPAAGTGVRRGGTPEHLALTLAETIRLALGHSRDAVFARLTREEQLLALEAAEERYYPRASLDASWSARDGAAGTGDVSVGPSLRVPTGGSFRLSWSKPVPSRGTIRAASLQLQRAVVAALVNPGEPGPRDPSPFPCSWPRRAASASGPGPRRGPGTASGAGRGCLGGRPHDFPG